MLLHIGVFIKVVTPLNPSLPYLAAIADWNRSRLGQRNYVIFDCMHGKAVLISSIENWRFV